MAAPVADAARGSGKATARLQRNRLTAVTGTTRRDSLDDLRSLLRSVERAAKGHWNLMGTHGTLLASGAILLAFLLPPGAILLLLPSGAILLPPGAIFLLPPALPPPWHGSEVATTPGTAQGLGGGVDAAPTNTRELISKG